MKLLHFADIHIGMENYSKLDPQTGLSTRLLDFLKTFDFIVDKAIEQDCDALIFAGDAYKTRDPNPTQQRGFGERIKKAAKHMPVILVVGNHDTPNAEGKANTLDIYSALEIDNVWISRVPELLKIPTKSGTLQIVTLPWLHKEEYKSVGEKLLSLYDKITSDSLAIFLSHSEVVGAEYGSEKGMAIANDVTIPLSLLQDRRLSYVALGHIHKHQVLSKPGDSPLVVYAGSPHRIDFGEEKEDKGVCLVTIDDKTKKANFEFIKTDCRDFLTITVNIKGADENPTKTVLDEIKKHQIKDKVIKLVINIPSECSEEIEIDKVKKALTDAHYIAGISKNVERVERQRSEETKDVETLTPVQALKKYFEFKKYSQEKQKMLEEYAAKLLEGGKTDYY
jgi:DNA repair protein SbcD/Mre11